jgi:hypothetical protein
MGPYKSSVYANGNLLIQRGIILQLKYLT